MTETPLLEILIGTYGRPLQAIDAVKSSLSINGNRVRVHCHSNGYEEKLEFLRNLDPRLRFGNFDKNQGPIKNWKKLISESNARFCMLLSDEDKINFDYIPKLLNWLEEKEEYMSVACCAIFDETENKYYYRPKQNIELINFQYTLFCRPIQLSYMSGYIFNVRILKLLDLDDLFNESIGNTYPHINTTHALLQYGLQGLFNHPIILKGVDQKVGGHAYEHLKNESQKESEIKNRKLNPHVYGAYARARQFYYMHNQIAKIKYPIFLFGRIMYDLDLVLRFYYCIKISNLDTGQNVDYFVEISRAKVDAQLNYEFRNNFVSQYFHILFKQTIYGKITVLISLFISSMRRVFGHRYTEK